MSACFRCRLSLLFIILLANCAMTCFFGCAPAGSSSGVGGGRQDPFQAAIADVEDKREIPFIEKSRPIFEALARRDYDKLFEMTSKHALKKVVPEQFAPKLDAQGNSIQSPAIADMTKEQFLEGLKRMENELGIPHNVLTVSVQTIDPNELAGTADPVDNMFNIGGMPKEIPNEIRRASLRVQIGVRVPEHHVKQAAENLGVSEEDIRSGKAFEDLEEPFLTAKIVLVEDNGLKIGYFEFMPRSIFD